MKYEPLLLRIWEVPAADLCPETGYNTNYLWYSSVLQANIIKLS
jgi:hypothetical protein